MGALTTRIAAPAGTVTMLFTDIEGSTDVAERNRLQRRATECTAEGMAG